MTLYERLQDTINSYANLGIEGKIPKDAAIAHVEDLEGFRSSLTIEKAAEEGY